MSKNTGNRRRSGPLLSDLPTSPDAATQMVLTERLKGHTTSPSWLPERVWPELDALRDEQLRLRFQVTDALEALDALTARFKSEDEGHAEQLRQAHRDGAPTSSEDRRTPAEQRVAERTAVEERLWAGVHVFAEHADRVIETIREHEDEWLADLRSRLVPAQEKRRRADALVVEAKAQEFELYRLGQWVQANADDQGFGRQPAPAPGGAPDQVSPEVLKDALERRWHRLKPWNGPTTEAAA